MPYPENVVLIVLLVAVFIVPSYCVVRVWRRTGSWRTMTLACLVLIPLFTSLAFGTLLAGATAFRVYVLKIGINGPQIGKTNEGYIAVTFFTCAVYAVGFVALWLIFFIPCIVFWGLIHPASFYSVFKGPRHVEPRKRNDPIS